MTDSVEALSGQIAVVTGASGAIGGAVALGLAKEGAGLCLPGRSVTKLEEVARRLRPVAPYVRYDQLDLESEEAIVEFADRLRHEVRRIDILVHSAGVISMGHLCDAPMRDLDWQYRINVRAPYLLTQALLPEIKLSEGQIVFINSSAGLDAHSTVGQYAATKHALKAVADALREEINPQGVRVTSIYVGRTASSMQASVHKFEQKDYSPELLLQPADVASIVISALALPRTAEVTDIHIRPLRKT
jgi:NADP-dependent 3-hydroxy acid dehydrogenase YdfG